MSNLILFATYWNEIEWIEASLDQIDVIDPVEVIICDGCFDPRQHNYSTDGTRNIIESYVAGNPRARMISALRLSRWQHYHQWLKPLPHETSGYLTLAKLHVAKSFHGWNPYRLNQMATFNHMLRIATHLTENIWFMSYDCDLFYGDEALAAFRNLNNEHTANMLTSAELTFFEDFEHVTADYEKRDYNNMPHRLFQDTRFIPTRHPARVVDGRYIIYTEFEKKKPVGKVYHYHVKSPQRLEAGFALGDRQPPQALRMESTIFAGEHPALIRKHFLR